MVFTVRRRSAFVALLLVITWMYWMNRSSLTTTDNAAADTSVNIHLDGDISSTDESEYGFPLPDAQRPVVTMSSVRYLRLLERRGGTNYSAYLKSLGVVNSSDRTIVLRYRTNTSTLLESPSYPGNLSAVFAPSTGNAMRMYAALYGIARRNGMRHVISATNPLLPLFRLNATVVKRDRPGQDSVQFVADPNVYDRHTEYFDPRIDIELVGDFSDWKYYGHVMRDLMENHFRFRETIQRDAESFLRRSLRTFNLSPSDVAVIAVHIRRGEKTGILREKGGDRDSAPGKAYFRHAVAFFNRLFNNKTMYVVCSNDMAWAKVNFVVERPTAFSVGHSAGVDFAILSRCNHSIVTTGTFGQWSAYLAGGVTVHHAAGAPTDVPLDAAFRKVSSEEDPRHTWIALS
ncbi:hypothetical protein NP493_1018g00051 [Ridgeia piscesae]|uniref:L-Fucosyltransferase n=1 Tax=Ridgeia piscesae TaxID=27915 RepID=A0AAD9NIS3_RIDPI|nr:hypothetical protein NP493_1018g00051 [Ridgeia piscesae]